MTNIFTLRFQKNYYLIILSIGVQFCTGPKLGSDKLLILSRLLIYRVLNYRGSTVFCYDEEDDRWMSFEVGDNYLV